ncbi:MAG: CDP-archaeol synthase, partial [Candidatus Andersenbacteria bacterium]
LWFFLPAGVANIAPVLAARYGWWKSLDVPLDRGSYLGKRRLLGDNKTMRGLLSGVLFGSITALIQYFLAPAELVGIVPEGSIAAIGWGALLGFGALLGDLIKSFFKRRINIAPGKSWIPFDQVDVVLGVLIVTSPFVTLSFPHIIVAFILIGGLMFVVSQLGVKSGIKKNI